MTVRELELGLRDLGGKLYSDEFTRERHDGFTERYRAEKRMRRRENVKEAYE
jgi:hypothetical protein